MFVARYPEWIATVLWADGTAAHFDGAKDCYKYLLDLPRYAPGRRAADITAIGVTEYYALARIDARQARYVVGSDVLGPMGHELVPLADAADAAAFRDDHAGVAVVRHGDVTLALLAALDAGRFEGPGQG
jgi:nitrous oxide reductase accessory protein NosL